MVNVPVEKKLKISSSSPIPLPRSLNLIHFNRYDPLQLQTSTTLSPPRVTHVSHTCIPYIQHVVTYTCPFETTYTRRRPCPCRRRSSSKRLSSLVGLVASALFAEKHRAIVFYKISLRRVLVSFTSADQSKSRTAPPWPPV